LPYIALDRWTGQPRQYADAGTGNSDGPSIVTGTFSCALCPGTDPGQDQDSMLITACSGLCALSNYVIRYWLGTVRIKPAV